MSEDSKRIISGAFEGNAHRCLTNAQAIVVAYAGSANADPSKIPVLFSSLCHLFATGELPPHAAPKTQGQTGY